MGVAVAEPAVVVCGDGSPRQEAEQLLDTEWVEAPACRMRPLRGKLRPRTAGSRCASSVAAEGAAPAPLVTKLKRVSSAGPRPSKGSCSLVEAASHEAALVERWCAGAVAVADALQGPPVRWMGRPLSAIDARPATLIGTGGTKY